MGNTLYFRSLLVSEEEKTRALMEHKLRKPFFPSFLSPSPRSNTRRRPIKHDSWVWCHLPFFFYRSKVLRVRE